MTNKIIIASGGTGGHIFPSIAVAKRLEELGYEVIYFTDVRGLKYLSEEKNQKIVLNVQGLSGGLINKIKSLFLIA
jgi:UDP-N-acetylglucosamine--N-acetylmuramyl-(pentapeptide) pyrophosphoryl-undecaprenol N-acetylglucosamine transferase